MVGPLHGSVLSLRIVMILVVTLLSLSAKLSAQTQVSASVDRDSIYQNDSLTLQIKGSSELALNSIGGIFDFGRNQISEPDLGALTDDFDILEQRQSRNMEVLNGNSRATTTWTYVLAPKRTGQLTIPAIEFQGQQTQALVIEVKTGRAPKDSARPPAVFFEIDIDKQAPYVQEQVLFTVRLFSLGQLESGDWSEPSASELVVERLGDTSTFYRMAYNQRYEVRERKYALFPQKSGELIIPAQRFQGVMIDMRQRRRVRVNESSGETTLKVKAPPAAFSGATWLPATSFELIENWSQAPETLQQGDSLTRSIEIKALGLLDSALPSLSAKTQVSGDTHTLKFYPEKPQSQRAPHAAGVQAERLENTAIIAVDAGSVSIDAIEIPWWDTLNDEQRIAVIPARRITIAASISSAPPETGSTANPSEAKASAGPANTLPGTSSEPSEAAQNSRTPTADQDSQAVSADILWSIIALMLFAWAASAWLLWQRGNKLAALATMAEQHDQQAKADTLSLAVLEHACKAQDANLPKMILAWLRQNPSQLGGGRTQVPVSIGDIEREQPALAKLLHRYEQARYASEDLSALSKLSEELLLELAKIAKRAKQLEGPHQGASKAHKGNTLLPFYP